MTSAHFLFWYCPTIIMVFTLLWGINELYYKHQARKYGIVQNATDSNI